MGSLCSRKTEGKQTYIQIQRKIPQMILEQQQKAPSQNKGQRKARRHQLTVIEQSFLYDEAKTAVKNSKKMTESEKLLILSCFSKHFMLSSLSTENKQSVINSMDQYSVQKGDIIFEQGQPARNFFILSQGELEVQINGKTANQVKQGESFGELALLQNSIRSATIIATTDSVLWGVNRETFRKLVQDSEKAVFNENKQFIETVPLLQKLTPEQKEIVSESLVLQTFKKDAYIITEGYEGD